MPAWRCPGVPVRPPTDAPARLRTADVVVVGAGQAGLSAAHHLGRRGFVPAGTGSSRSAEPGRTERTYVVLDGEDGPGGAWRHRWRSLRMSTVNDIYDLPGMEQPPVDPQEPAVEALPRYFGAYEDQLELPVLRPVEVRAVRRADADPRGLLLVETDCATWQTRAVINATGTWRRPFWPYYPGRETFLGRQLHTHDYVSAEELAGRHVVVVGGGISAVQHLVEISEVTTTTWVTRREPRWREGDFGPEAGRRAVAMVEERVREGLPPRSVVAVTGLVWRPEYAAAARRGAFARRPMFERIEPEGVRWADGTFQRADVIYWATGFRAALDHLAPLGLRAPGGGIRMDGTQVTDEPRVHLVGYGPSASTVGANRAGREAVNRLLGVLASWQRTH